MASQWLRDIECWLGSFVIVQEIRTSIAKKPYNFVIFQRGGSGPPCSPTPSGFAPAVCILFPDKDECTSQPGLCEHNCSNTAGSYICTCPPQHSLRDDGRSCRPFDDYSNVYFFFSLMPIGLMISWHFMLLCEIYFLWGVGELRLSGNHTWGSGWGGGSGIHYTLKI